MIRYVWHVASLMIVFCLISGNRARSATGSSYQHVSSGSKETAEHVLPATDASSSSSSSASSGAASSSSSSSSSTIWKDMSLVYRIYQQCASENLSVCLKVKLLTGLEKALRMAKTLKIIEGVQFVKSVDDGKPQSAKASAKMGHISEKDIEAVLPRALDAKEQVLNNMIFKKLAGFLQDHTLQVKFPDISADDHFAANSVEGRKKKDKKGGGGAYIMIPLLLGGTFVPIAYGALAMLAGKALIVSKLALVLASIIGIKKLLSGGHKESSHEVVVQSGGHSGWGRDFDLAYSGWKPAKETAKHM